jgi:hypothetical protein
MLVIKQCIVANYKQVDLLEGIGVLMTRLATFVANKKGKCQKYCLCYAAVSVIKSHFKD